MFNRIAFLAGALIFLAVSLNAQKQPVETNVAAGPISNRIAPVCFISGANKKYLSYCVTASGTILNLTTPLDHPQLFNSEGYGICNESPVASYWDYQVEGQSPNWNEPILLSQTATSMKIARTTADGIWTLTQTILQDKNTPAVKVVMALKNNSAAPRVVYLTRFADIDSDASLNNFSATTQAAFGWNASVPFGTNNGYGLQLRNVGKPQFGYLQGFARPTFLPPNPCDFAGDSAPNPLVNVSGSVALAYVDTIGAKKTKTATIIYRGL